jgi:sec-independent protein translocase protein TatB
MFEVGFSELLMVGLVALLVIGPERLPKAARIAGFWLGRARTTVATVKAEIKQELHAEEMRQLLQQQALTEDLNKILDETQAVAHDIQQTLHNNPTVNNDDRTA